MYTPEAYEHLLEILISREYRFANFQETASEGGKVVYLRHDIDYSLDWASSFARINSKIGVAGTFFFQLRSPTYNLHAYSTLSTIAEISGLGQNIALHHTIDGKSQNDDRNLVARIRADHQSAQAILPQLSPVFSWHNPSLAPGLVERGLDLVVPGMVNAYGRYFLKDGKYFSDSNLRHSVDEFERIFEDDEPRLQLLFHPFQWMARGQSMQEILAKTWAQVVREKETEFLNNHVYRRLFPQGMPDEWLAELANRLASFHETTR